MDQSIVQHIAIEECGIRGKNLPVKFGSQNCALELAWMSIPVPQEDVLPVGGFDQGQKSAKKLRVGGSLDRLVGFEVDSNDQNGPGFGFPKKGLVSTTFDVVVLQLGDSMMVGVEDEDASMVAIVVAVRVSRQSKGMFASDFEVLA